MNSKSWDRQVTHVTAWEFDPTAEAKWFKFIEWYEGLVKWVISSSPYAEDVAVSSPAIEKRLWTTGINHLADGLQEDFGHELHKMPDFPLEWPHTYPATEVRARLSQLAAMQPLEMTDEAHGELAQDFRRQAIKLLQLADEGDETRAVTRAEAAARALSPKVRPNGTPL